MTWECNPWSDIKWHSRSMFLCPKHNLALQYWQSNEMSLTHDDIHHSSSDVFSVLSEEVRCRDLTERDLWQELSFHLLIYIKPPRFTLEDGSHTNMKCEHTAMGLLLKKLQGRHVQSERWRVASGLPLNGAILHQMVLPPLFCVAVLCSSQTAMKIQYTLLLI